MNHAVIDESEKLSFQDTPFPEVVKQLSQTGVRSYYADLIRLEKIYYGDGDTYAHRLSLGEAPPVADQFDEPGIKASIRAVQRGEIGYARFLQQIMQAVCSTYAVFLPGRKAIYFGQDGAFHIEHFPDRAP
jgi:uncharacterized protein YbcV (DUF1398 family)